MQKEYLNSVKVKYPPSEKKLIDILKKIAPKLKEENPLIKKILLFGSYARKQPHFGSDVDLIIIVSERIENDFELIYERLFDFSLEFEWAPLIFTEERFNSLTKKKTPFFQVVLEEAITIWSET